MRANRVLGILILMVMLRVDVLYAQSPRFSILISAPRTDVKSNSAIDVKIILTNLLDKQLLVYTSGLGERDYTVRVSDKDGREPLETRYLRAVRGKDTSDPLSKTSLVIVGGGGFHGVRPGESFDLTIDLTKLYVLKPGKYTVQVERLDDENKALVKSNAITVTVNP